VNRGDVGNETIEVKEKRIGLSFPQRLRSKFFFKVHKRGIPIPNPKSVVSSFDKISNYYDLLASLGIGGYKEVHRYFVNRCVGEGDRVIELCCGTGISTLYAAEKAKEIIGLDISKGMLETGKRKRMRKGCRNVSFILGDVRKYLPFDENTFDLVMITFSAPIHIPLFEGVNKQVVEEARRILTKEGRLAILHVANEVSEDCLTASEYMNLLKEYKKVNLEKIEGLFMVVLAQA